MRLMRLVQREIPEHLRMLALLSLASAISITAMLWLVNAAAADAAKGDRQHGAAAAVPDHRDAVRHLSECRAGHRLPGRRGVAPPATCPGVRRGPSSRSGDGGACRPRGPSQRSDPGDANSRADGADAGCSVSSRSPCCCFSRSTSPGCRRWPACSPSPLPRSRSRCDSPAWWRSGSGCKRRWAPNWRSSMGSPTSCAASRKCG